MNRFLLLIIFALFISPIISNAQNSMSFNGTSQYVEVVDNEYSLQISNNFTIEAWIKPDDISGEKTILIKGLTNQCGHYGLFIKDGNLAYVSSGACGWGGRGPNSSLQIGVWQHVAAVGNNGNLKLYINGVLKDEITLSSTIGTINADPLWIGRSVFSINNFFFDGLMDEVRIWSIGRTQSEIQNNMNTELSGLESNLALYYKFDDSEAECDLVDCSVNENHGVIQTIDVNSGLPQFVNEQTNNLTNVECGVSLDNCASPLASPDYNSLMAIYNSTNGDNWNNNTNWNTDNPISTWYGVTAVGNRATELNFSVNNLTGTLPPEIGDLTNLEYLSFYSGNSISGNLPPQIGNLTELRTLSFEYNNFTGEIPASYINLTKMESLWFNNNALTGNIPAFIASFPDLKYFDISFNDFEGTLPDFTGLNDLSYLSIGNNHFFLRIFQINLMII